MGCDGYSQFKWKLKEQAGTNQETTLPDILSELQNFLWKVGTPEYDASLDEAAGMLARAERVFLVVIGTHAKDVYEALAQLLDLDENAADAPQNKQGIGSRIIATMSAITSVTCTAAAITLPTQRRSGSGSGKAPPR